VNGSKQQGEGKRRLPVIPPDEPETIRPAWQWTLIGGAGAILILFPLLQLAQWLVAAELRRLAPGDDPETTAQAFRALGAGARFWLSIVSLVAPLFAVGLGALAGGALVGRFGAAAGVREATWAGAASGGFVAAVGGPGMLAEGQLVGWLVSASLFVGLGALSGRLGGRLGLRARGPRSG
jgi:hypothetical protein